MTNMNHKTAASKLRLSEAVMTKESAYVGYVEADFKVGNKILHEDHLADGFGANKTESCVVRSKSSIIPGTILIPDKIFNSCNGDPYDICDKLEITHEGTVKKMYERDVLFVPFTRALQYLPDAERNNFLVECGFPTNIIVSKPIYILSTITWDGIDLRKDDVKHLLKSFGFKFTENPSPNSVLIGNVARKKYSSAKYTIMQLHHFISIQSYAHQQRLRRALARLVSDTQGRRTITGWGESDDEDHDSADSGDDEDQESEKEESLEDNEESESDVYIKNDRELVSHKRADLAAAEAYLARDLEKLRKEDEADRQHPVHIEEELSAEELERQFGLSAHTPVSDAFNNFDMIDGGNEMVQIPSNFRMLF